MSPVARKNGWQTAEQTGHETPYQFQHLLGRAQCDADEVNPEVRSVSHRSVGQEDGILAVDETGFIKQGTHSVEVQVQRVFLSYSNCP
jgi:SRSO17 transposase